MFYLFLIILFPLVSFADLKSIEYRSENEPISEKYDEGPYLLYDCVQQSWICVSEQNFKDCEQTRASRLELHRHNLHCAGIKRFASKTECFNEQAKQVSFVSSKRFCLHPERRTGSTH